MKLDPKLALALFQIAVTIIAAIQRSGWYQQGRDSAYADMSAEQKQRLAIAEAARADADIFADGRVRDPNELPQSASGRGRHDLPSLRYGAGCLAALQVPLDRSSGHQDAGARREPGVRCSLPFLIPETYRAMTERTASEEARLSAVERDSRDHARIITEFSKSFPEIEIKEAVRAEADKHLDERLDRIEDSIKSVYGLGKWLLAAVGSTLVVAVVGFILKGGPLG